MKKFNKFYLFLFCNILLLFSVLYIKNISISKKYCIKDNCILSNLYMPYDFSKVFHDIIFKNLNFKNHNNYNSCFKNLNNTNLKDKSPYIKNSIIPKSLYVISTSNMSKKEQTMIATLQGIVATKSDKQIYVTTSSEPDYEIWLQDLKENHKVKIQYIKNPWKLLKKFKCYVNGYILYSDLKKPSINNACTLASLKDGIVIDKTLECTVRNYGITKLIKDCSDTDKYWAFNNLWNEGLNHSTVIELPPERSMALRDYAIISKSLIFYEEDIKDESLRKSIFTSMDDNSCCLGWGPDEHTNVSIASKFGVYVVAADWSYNLSTLSSYPYSPLKQHSKEELPNENGVHYVTFIMSDGDNQQWLLGNNYTSPKWYGSSNRGSFPLGWSISPSIYYLAPTVFKEYYTYSSSLLYNSYYLTPPSGNGYIYPSKFPNYRLDNYTNALNEYMKSVDENYVLILDDDAFYRKDLWDKYTKHSNIQGLLYLNYNKNNYYNGKILWSNNKPVVSCRDLLWYGLENESQLIKNINDRVNLGYTNITDPNSYTFVYVHVWSKTLDDVQSVVNKLKENNKVRIVSPEIFMKLIKFNIPSY